MSTQPPVSPRPFDPSALTEPVDPKEVAAFARASASTAKPWSGSRIIMVLLFVAIGFITLLTLLGTLARNRSSSTSTLPWIVFGVVGLVALVIGVVSSRRTRERRYRLHRFAAANGLTYVPTVTSPALPGMIFHIGNSRFSSDVLRGSHPRFAEFGNYQYTVRRGKNSVTSYWGYVAIRLDVPLPHIVLDAVGNNRMLGASNLPAGFTRTQRLSLEGDFDRFFTLYCPEGYEPDALYLFTPDIMQRFIDNAAELDVEIIDNWLFLYSQRPFATLDPATWAWLFGAAGAMMTKLDQWARWRDERLAEVRSGIVSPAVGGAAALPVTPPAGVLTPPPGVAPPGRRLRRAFPWGSVAIFVVMGAFFLWWNTR